MVQKGIAMTKTVQGVEVAYDPITGKVWNSLTEKWVKNYRPSSKGKAIGANIKTVESKREYYVWPEMQGVINSIDPSPAAQERLWLMLTMLCRQQGRLKHYAKDDDEIPPAYFSHAEWDKIGGRNWQKHIGKLQENMLVYRNPLWTTKYNDPMFGYVLDERFFVEKKAKRKVQFEKVAKSLEGFYRIKIARLNEQERQMFNEQKHYEFDITLGQFNDEMTNRYFMTYIKRFEHKKRLLDDYKDKTLMTLKQYLAKQIAGTWNQIEAWRDTEIEDRVAYFKHDDFGNRFFTAFTGIPAEIRKYIVTKSGQNINYALDLKTSQFIFLANAVKAAGIDPGGFISDVESEKYYERMAERAGLVGDESRAIAKIISMKGLFGDIEGAGHKEFCEIYPGVGDWIGQIKSGCKNEEDEGYNRPIKRNARLARMLQRMESELFRNVWGRLMAANIEFINIHDGIEIDKKYAVKVKAIMDEVFQKYMQVKYKIDEEDMK